MLGLPLQFPVPLTVPAPTFSLGHFLRSLRASPRRPSPTKHIFTQVGLGATPYNSNEHSASALDKLSYEVPRNLDTPFRYQLLQRLKLACSSGALPTVRKHVRAAILL